MSRQPEPQPDASADTAPARSTVLTRLPGRLGHVDIDRLAGLEGRQVSVALADGSRIDDCQLVSCARRGVATLWLFDNGADRFVPLHHVVDVWEASPPASGCVTGAPAA